MGLKIGELARATGTNIETVRYYERIGLLPAAERTSANYRSYDPNHLDRLNFIRHARGLGFTLTDIRSMLSLSDQPDRDCAEVDQIASEHLKATEEKIARLTSLRDELGRVVGQCREGRGDSCRILQALGDHSHCQNGHS